MVMCTSFEYFLDQQTITFFWSVIYFLSNLTILPSNIKNILLIKYFSVDYGISQVILMIFLGASGYFSSLTVWLQQSFTV